MTDSSLIFFLRDGDSLKHSSLFYGIGVFYLATEKPNKTSQTLSHNPTDFVGKDINK